MHSVTREQKSKQTQFLTAASCPKKDYYTPPAKNCKKAARKATQKFTPVPVLLLS